jgi:hypothetical protein
LGAALAAGPAPEPRVTRSRGALATAGRVTKPQQSQRQLRTRRACATLSAEQATPPTPTDLSAVPLGQADFLPPSLDV